MHLPLYRHRGRWGRIENNEGEQWGRSKPYNQARVVSWLTGLSQSSLRNLKLGRKLREIIKAKLFISPMEKLRLKERKGFAQSASVAELGLTALSPDYRFCVLSTALAGIETWALNKPDLEAAQIWREMVFLFSISKLANLETGQIQPFAAATCRENAKAPSCL